MCKAKGVEPCLCFARPCLTTSFEALCPSFRRSSLARNEIGSQRGRFGRIGVEALFGKSQSLLQMWSQRCRRCACLRSGSSSYLFHSKIESPSQKKSQRSTVRVPNLCGNLIDTGLAGLQEMHGAFNAQTLEI